MINNVTFTGREEMLGQPIKAAERKIEGFISQCELMPRAQELLAPSKTIDKATASLYSNPFAIIPEGTGENLLIIV